MKIFIAIGMALLLAACRSPVSQPADLSRTDIGILAGCPALPGVHSVEINRKDGIDFRFCKYTHKKTGKLLFDVYVGEHPHSPEGLKYGGTIRSNGKDLIWFNTPSGGWGKPRIWHTYLPTGSPRGTVMVVSFTTHRLGQLEVLAPLVAHLQPSL
jgi:hypothetical protein